MGGGYVDPAEETPHMNSGGSSVFNDIAGFWTPDPASESLSHQTNPRSPTKEINNSWKAGSHGQFNESEEGRTGSEFSYLGALSKDEYEMNLVSRPSNATREVTNRASKGFYTIMTMQTDTQDLSFVEKVILPWRSIESLCNGIVGQSAKVVEGRRVIDFQRLNRVRMKMVGVFGGKSMIRHFLQHNGLEVHTELYKAMESDKLAPGLYAWLNTKENCTCLFVTYWHAGSALPKASRKDMSCNFIRYIVDLCDNVFVCLEASQVSKSLFSEMVRPTKQQRTQRLQIGLVKASEDSVNLAPGFTVESTILHNMCYIDGKTEHVQGYRLSEGHHRIALLVCTTCPRKKSIKKLTDNWAKPRLTKLLKEDKDRYNVDFTKLPDTDFINFLRTVSMEHFTEWQALKELHAKRQSSLNEKAYCDDHIESQSVDLDSLLSSCVDCCLQYAYPWEESLCTSPTAQSTSPVFDTESHRCSSSLDESPLRRPISIRSPISRKQFEENMSRLQQRIYNVLLGESCTQRMLIFPGSKIRLTRSPVQTDVQADVYTMESCSETPFAMYGTPIGFSFSGTDDSKGEIFEAEILKSGEKHSKGPILSEDSVQVTINSPNKTMKEISKGHWILQVSHDSGLQSWLLAVAGNVMVDLRKRAILLSFVMSDSISISGKLSMDKMLARQVLEADDKELLREVLEGDDPLEVLRPWFEAVDFKLVRDFWAALLSRPELETPHLTDLQDVKALCTQQHKKLRKRLSLNICRTFKRFSNDILKKTNAENVKTQCDVLQKALEGEQSDFLMLKKEELSTRHRIDGLPKLSVLKFYISEGWNLQSLLPMATKFSVTYGIEDYENPRVIWKGLELMPMKTDLDNLLINPDFQFTPTLSKAHDIIDLDPQSQTLVKAIFLKSGQLLLFVEDTSEKILKIYSCCNLGVKASQQPVFQMKRGYNLLAFDESTRFFAVYSEDIHTVKSYRLDEHFKEMTWTGADVNLSTYNGIDTLIWMDFIAGKKELVFIDASQRVRICAMTTPAMVRPGNIHLGTAAPILKMCISPQTNFLMVMRQVLVTSKNSNDKSGLVVYEHGDDEPMTENSDDKRCEVHGLPKNPERKMVMEAYKIDDILQHFSTQPLDICINDQSKLEMSVMSFASQVHLVMHSVLRPDVVQSILLKFTSASEVCNLQQIQRLGDESDARPEQESQPGPVLDYFYQIYEKFATYPALSSGTVRHLNINVLLGVADRNELNAATLAKKCLEYVESSVHRLQRDKGKDFSRLEMRASVLEVTFQSLPGSSESVRIGAIVAKVPDTAVGDWIQQLVCLVPIQIARADNNSLKPLVDGVQLSSNIEYVDAISLANAIQFGLYETLLEGWKGPIKVLSSMGKQSSGKSYLLNHLSGSLLDVAGGRCTDGVWMTVRPGDGCMYVLLDFEGLGSFERSEQEDMLLSMLNAAISNLTIFNKKDFHLDKETESIFERFQNAVSLVKTDPKLFKGLFYVAIKDVDASDVDDLKKEFFSKISHICMKSQENFLTKMYGGAVEIAAMPSFNKPEFYESIGDIGRTVQDLVPSYHSGQNFLSDLKLLIAQVATKDWSPIDVKRVALKLNLLKQHMKTAVGSGCMLSDGQQPLVRFNDQALVPDDSIDVDGYNFSIQDTGLELMSFSENRVLYEVLLRLMGIFEGVVHRTGKNDEQWHVYFENFIAALIERRRHRVMHWITLNTAEFLNEGDSQRPKMEAESLLGELQQKLLLCSCKCSKCFLRCVREKKHPLTHTCMGNHKCAEMCTYCSEENGYSAGVCDDVAGHAGQHDCGVKSHTCSRTCEYFPSSSNCNKSCSKKVGHDGTHRCNSSEHACNKSCSLPLCKNPCVCPIEVGNHSQHFCYEKYCPVPCSMPECNRTCATKDHFHSIRDDVVHMCGSEHQCTNNCEHDGICEVLTEVTKRTLTFQGKRDTFDYEAVSEQNGRRKGCCLVIPPFHQRHDELHSCSTNKNVAHYCETRCTSCGYFCNKVIGHAGKHNTSHGNMRDVYFVAESEDIDISGRKYSWGESGVAELCHLHCKAQGRGHIHIIRCPESVNTDGPVVPCRKLFDGARHETCKYGPDENVPKDELTHAAYWEYVNFVDPCTPDEVKHFALCSYKCKSDEHSSADGTSAIPASYSCTEPLWHQPILRSETSRFGGGYITEDGHHFSCDHSKNVATSVIFVVDRSSSMASTDICPTMTQFSSHNNRLGCVYEAVFRFIRIRLTSVQQDVVSVVLFNHAGYTAACLQDMRETIVNDLLRHGANGSTTYTSGLQHAESIILQSLQNAGLGTKAPVIIFLSDGGNNGGGDPVSYIRNLRAIDPRLLVHTIMFGHDPSKQILADMAKAGNGTFEVSLDEVQLTRRFEGLARSIKPKVSSLLCR